MGNNLMAMRRRVMMAQPHKEKAEGAIASFVTNLTKPMQVTANITPIQDLSGGDPFPPGGGKNKWAYDASFSKDDSVLYNSYDVNLPAGTYTVSGVFTSGDTTNNKVRVTFRNGSGGLATAKPTANSGARTSDTVTIEEACTKIYIYGGDTTSTKYAMTATEFMIESGSTATAYSPYSNICPISGWTGCTVSDTGKNLFDKTTVTEGKCINGDTLVNKTWGNVSDYINVKAGVTYFLSNVVGSSSLNAGSFFDINKNYVSVITTPTGSDASFSVTIPVGVAYVRLNVRNTHLDDAMLEVGNTASAYSAYSGTTLSVTFPTPPGTVYGGTLKVNKDGTGTLVIDREVIDGGSLTWTYDSRYTRFLSSAITGMKSTTTRTMNLLCSAYQTISDGRSIANVPDKSIYNAGENKVYIKDTSYTDGTVFESAMEGVQIVYDLATPVTYTLTSQQVGQLLAKQGQNNVWADTGNVTVQFLKQ